MPIGTYGVSAELAVRIAAAEDADLEDTGGVGGTLAGNALSLAATRATLGEVLTPEAFARMDALRERFVAGVEAALERFEAPWSIVSLGARAEYRFAPSRRAPAPSPEPLPTGPLEEYLHLYLLNRGVLITPFRNMALMCPATSEEQVDQHQWKHSCSGGNLRMTEQHRKHHRLHPDEERYQREGLKANAIGFVDGLIIGIASTAPPTRWPRCWRSW